MTGSETDSHRKFPRQRTLKGARIVCTGSLTYDVMIRDLSESGVRLKLGSPFAVPATFQLVIHNPNTGTSEKRHCELRWQRGDQAGAEFVAAAPAAAPVPLAAPSLRRTLPPA